MENQKLRKFFLAILDEKISKHLENGEDIM